jgi:acetate kinase
MSARLVLVVNAGSSSLKLRLLEGETLAASADLPATAEGFDTHDLAERLAAWPIPDLVGHRVVHGGTQFTSAVRLTPDVERRLHQLATLAPLHQPKSLAGIKVLAHVRPTVPAIACFDTSFHRTIPIEARTYAVPAEWRERHGVRRYGFHGLSHAYAARRAAALLGPDAGRVVTCHLGAGASLCAVLHGRSVDTTMGFTPLDGLVMATRSGSLDPGLVLWLEEQEGLSPHQVATALEHHSGMLALAGTSDMSAIVARAQQGDATAQPALDVYLHRLVAGIAAMTASMEGIDALVFTGGVGENSAYIRQHAAERLRWLGVAIDPTSNANPIPDAEITAHGSRVRTLVIAAREDLQIAHEVRAVAT